MKTTTRMADQKTITKDMSFGEVLKRNPESAEILFANGLYCMGCGMAMYESLEDGCKSHGMGKKEIDELIKKINGEKISGKIKRKKPEVSAQ